MTDVKKQVAKRRQQLRLRIENMKITRSLLAKQIMGFKDKNINHSIERAERELAMLEENWKC
jgi:hypothetical protein